MHIRKDQDGTTGVLIHNRNASGSPTGAVQFISGAFDLSDNRYAMISSAGGSAPTLQFWTGSGATPTEKMRIAAGGNVGIGTNNPGELLELYSSNQTYLRLNTANTANKRTGIRLAQNGTTQFEVGVDLPNDNTRDFYVYDSTVNAARFLIDATGIVYSYVQHRSPIYYDNDDTNYYANPNGTSSLNTVTMAGLITGATSGSNNVNTTNDTGSFSARGNSTTVAAMSFHRTSTYAINMGLGTDNVFRIGGWSASNNCFQMTGTGDLTMLGNVTAYSDIKLKDDIVKITCALDKVLKLNGYSYTRKDTGQKQIGVIAQEVLEVIPEVVQRGVGDDDTLSVAYGNMVALLIEAIKEQQTHINSLEEKITNLENR